MSLPLYIDIDGTLTTLWNQTWGPVVPKRIAKVKALIASGQEVVIWSGGGGVYAKAFADKYDLHPIACLGKPHLVIDDCATIRPPVLRIVTPEDFFK